MNPAHSAHHRLAVGAVLGVVLVALALNSCASSRPKKRAHLSCPAAQCGKVRPSQAAIPKAPLARVAPPAPSKAPPLPVSQPTTQPAPQPVIHYRDVQAFWATFRSAVLAGNNARLQALTARPFETLDNELDDRRQAHAPNAVASVVRRLLREDTGLEPHPESLHSWIARHAQLPEQLLSPDHERARVGLLEFAHTEAGWQLAHGYLPRRGTSIAGESAAGPHAHKVGAPAWMLGLPSWYVRAGAAVGLFEDLRKGRHHPEILAQHRTVAGDFRDDETPWCSSFINRVLKDRGIAGTDNARALSWLNWGVALREPRAGAIVVLHKRRDAEGRRNQPWQGNHLGFFVAQNGGVLRLLGGNQINQVNYADYPLAQWQVLGYRWPTAAAADGALITARSIP